MINSFLNFKYPFSVILIVLILLPNSSSNLLNGLPVSTVIETILIVIVLPIFFLF